MGGVQPQSETVWRGDFITLQVSRWNYPASSSDDRGYTVWNSDLQTIEESKYYKIADNWYVEDLEEAIKAHKVRSSRFEYRCSLRDPNCSFIVLDSEKAREIGRKFLTRSIGYKRISNKEIIVKKYEGHSFYKYAISYKGHEYRIYA